MFTNQFVISEALQISVTSVAGELMLGAACQPFSHNPRPEFGKALTVAESNAGGGKPIITRWRDGPNERGLGPSSIPRSREHTRAQRGDVR